MIYADPPWRYNDRKCNGACEHHYKTMKLEEIKQLPVKDLTEKDCVLFLWATYPMMKEAMELIEAWGFKHKTIAFQWIKLNKSGNGKFFGLGRWTRGNTEPCLLAVKGKPHRNNNGVSQIIEEPLRSHSQKPDITRDKIKILMGEDSRCLELFARQKVEGWDCWGNEV
ncbi:MT-A70 family methyltransferase [Enterocloster clostridioformis]